jgi:hypothetical protein
VFGGGLNGGAGAMIAPGAINIPPGGIVGRTWSVMSAETKIYWLNDNEPPRFPPGSGWILDGQLNDKIWKVKYTG